MLSAAVAGLGCCHSPGRLWSAESGCRCGQRWWSALRPELPACSCSGPDCAAQCVYRWLFRTAVVRMGCCTSLPYGTVGVSKSTVKVALTSALHRSHAPGQQVRGGITCVDQVRCDLEYTLGHVDVDGTCAPYGRANASEHGGTARRSWCRHVCACGVRPW
jgi:hypothetical protein